MAQISGQSGRLTLSDSYVKFENWNIYADGGRLTERSGSFEIQRSDYLFKVMPLDILRPISADFFGNGNNNYNEEIIITEVPDITEDPVIVQFKVGQHRTQ